MFILDIGDSGDKQSVLSKDLTLRRELDRLKDFISSIDGDGVAVCDVVAVLVSGIRFWRPKWRDVGELVRGSVQLLVPGVQKKKKIRFCLAKTPRQTFTIRSCR